MSKNIKAEMMVDKYKIEVIRENNREYISLTDLARYANAEEPKIPVYAWMRNKDVLAYLGLWEKINNRNFKRHEFVTFEQKAGKNNFYICQPCFGKNELSSSHQCCEEFYRANPNRKTKKICLCRRSGCTQCGTFWHDR